MSKWRAWWYSIAMRFVSEIVGIAGVGAFVYGCALIYSPAAWMVGGACAIAYGAFASRGES